MSPPKRLLTLLLAHPRELVLAGVSMVLLAATTGLYPLLIDMLTTSLFADPAQGAVNPWADRVAALLERFGIEADVESMRSRASRHVLLVFGAVVLVKAASQGLRFHQMGLLGQKVTQDLRETVFRGLLRQSTSFFDQRGSGGLVSRVMNDVNQVEQAATYALPVMVGDVLKVVVLAGICVFEYGRLSLIALCVLPLTALPIVRFGKMLKRYAKRSQEALGELTHRVTETLGGMPVVKVFSGEAFEAERFRAENERYFETMKKSVLVRALQTPVTELIGVAALLVTMAWAESEIAAGHVRPGEVVAFLLALVLLYEPLKAVGRISGVLVPGLAAAERVFQLADHVPEVQEVAQAAQVPPLRAALELRDVSFRYAGAETLALDGVSLRLEKGRTIALVGPSGSGKSTVARLIPRLYDVSGGAILLDGVDVREATLTSLRAQIAIVAQENFLFDDTLRGNIAYARPEATEEEIRQAAQAAFALEFIERLPLGLDTRTGERGVQLSGGQRQRIAIARAFLKNAPILILDEATSALDAESESEVQRALEALVRDRTTLVIAHRLSTVRNADEIVVLDRGRVVERGSHDALVAAGGLYGQLLQRFGER